MLPILAEAYEDGTISPNPLMNPAQAVRILTALAPASNSGIAQCNYSNVAGLVTKWLGFPPTWQSYQPGDDVTGFWPTADPHEYTYLLLCAITDGHVQLINEIFLKYLGITAAGLAALTEADWERAWRCRLASIRKNYQGTS